MTHPDSSTIARFVMGALEDDADFIAHVGTCEECSRKVQAEAEIEIAMIAVQTRAAAIAPAAEPQAPTPLRFPRRVLGGAFVLAAAAGLLMWVGHQRHASSAAVAVVSCPDGDNQLACIAEAHRSKSQLDYPKDTPIAALGTDPGMSVYIVPQSSDGNVAEMDAYLARATSDFRTCAEKAIVAQSAPVQTGEVGVKFAIGPTGLVETAQTVMVFAKDSKTILEAKGVEDADARFGGTDMALARCLGKTAIAFKFHGTGQTVHISLSAKYVWRE